MRPAPSNGAGFEKGTLRKKMRIAQSSVKAVSNTRFKGTYNYTRPIKKRKPAVLAGKPAYT
jgi:hypothetical protein